MELTDFISYEEFYTSYISDPQEQEPDQYLCCCPLHDDKHPSFSYNTQTGLWTCFSNCGSGNIYDFIAKKEGITVAKEKTKFLEKKFNVKISYKKIIEKQVYMDYHKDLLNNHGALDWLSRRRGIEIDTIKKFKIGMGRKRYTIPIFDEDKNCVNIRMYTPNKSINPSTKVISYTDLIEGKKINYGGIKLYPIENLKKKKIILTEGEMDCLLMNQLGFNAVTITGGAGSFRREWGKEYFTNKVVYICYDIDAAGDKGAIRVAKILNVPAENVRIVLLKTAISEPKNADITDYFTNYNNTPDDFKGLMDEAKTFKNIDEQTRKIRSKTYKKVELAKASHSANAMKYIEISSLVSGKNYPPYEIPDGLKLSCSGAYSEKVCPFCPMYMKENYEDKFDLKDYCNRGSILSLIDISDSMLFKNIMKILNIPMRCDKLKIDVISYVNIEEIILIPEIDFSADENYEYVQQVAYYMGHGIKTNQVYNLKGLALPDPRTQQATQLFHEAKPAVDSIDQFKMTGGMYKSLEIFQPEEDTLKQVYESYKKRYDNIQSISGIYDRIDIALAYDIIFHSALQVNFQGKTEKAWMECLLIGDSGCGKTELAKSMINHYKVGEFVTGENTSVAGLLGGLSQNSKRWTLNWGKIPLNNRRLLFIDEVSGMSTDDISLFSGVRSSGIAELTKIRTEKTMAMTRKIWVGNPRKMGQNNRNMMEYSFGCVAVRELIGNLEDIRRFDFVVSAHSEEVNSDVYNISKELNEDDIIYSSSLSHDLIMWIWSRNKSQIRFQKSAVDSILEYSKKMGEKFYHGIPIVEAADQRLKIMRGAVAMAGMMFSTNADGSQIIIKKCHVDFFYGWLDRIYNKPSLRYADWSKREKSKNTLKSIKEVNEVISNDIVSLLMELDVFNISTLDNLSGWERTRIKNMLAVCYGNNCFSRQGTSLYKKTQAFIRYLNMRESGEIKVKPKEETPW